MPPQLAFMPCPLAGPPDPDTGPAQIDLAGNRRPCCTVTLPQAAGPGIWTGDCGCGASFAVSVCGNSGDPRRLLLACWERQQQRPARQANLL